MFLADHPLCHDCSEQGRITPANEVHHIIDRQERPDLAYDAANLMALCKSCHSSRTTRERLAKSKRG